MPVRLTGPGRGGVITAGGPALARDADGGQSGVGVRGRPCGPAVRLAFPVDHPPPDSLRGQFAGQLIGRQVQRPSDLSVLLPLVAGLLHQGSLQVVEVALDRQDLAQGVQRLIRPG